MATWEPPRWLDQVSGIAWRMIVAVAAVVLVIAALVYLRIVVLPLLFAVILGSVLVPVAGRLRRAGFSPLLAAATTLAAFVGAIGATIWLVFRTLYSGWDQMVSLLNDGASEISTWLHDVVATNPDQSDEIVSSVRQVITSTIGLLVRGIFATVPLLAEVLTAIGLTIVILFFLLKDHDRIWRWVQSFVPGDARDQFAASCKNVWGRLGQYLRGTAVVASVDAVFIGLGALVLGVPFAGAIAIFTFFMAFIPTFGAIISGAFAVLLGLADEGWGTAIAMLVVVLLVQQIESNLLQPVILGKAVRLHPLAIMLSLIVGGVLAGILGLFLAVPVTASVVAVFDDLRTAGWFGVSWARPWEQSHDSRTS